MPNLYKPSSGPNMLRNGAAVSCSAVGYRLGGVKLGIWLTGKPCRALVVTWHRCMGVGVVWMVTSLMLNA